MYLTRWQDIYSHLKNKGFDVYAPAQHTGVCKKKYVVVKSSEQLKLDDYSITRFFYTILCYVPKDEYSILELFVESVKKALDELQDRIKIEFTGSQAQSYYDETVKAHMVSFQYIVYKHIKI